MKNKSKRIHIQYRKSTIIEEHTIFSKMNLKDIINTLIIDILENIKICFSLTIYINYKTYKLCRHLF